MNIVRWALVLSILHITRKNDLKYSDDSALAKVDEYAEAWSYYLIKASVELAKENAHRYQDTKYAAGILPIDTYKRSRRISKAQFKMPWDELRKRCKTIWYKNATVSAIMPAETSAQFANANKWNRTTKTYLSQSNNQRGVQGCAGISSFEKQIQLLWDQKIS